MLIDTILPSDSSLRFRKNLLEAIEKLMMTIDHKIKDKKLWFDIIAEAAKILSAKTDTDEYLIGEDILPPD